MKIRALEVYWHPGKSTIRETVMRHLRDDPEIRKIVARMARSEVKNYLAHIAEEAMLPFHSPEDFLGRIDILLKTRDNPEKQ
jgi:hypothetical protein